jgi:hypothetical protein
VKVDHDVEPPRPERASYPQVLPESRHATCPRDGDHLVEVRVAVHDRRRGLLDQIRQARIREAAAERANGRRGEDDVADEAQPHQQDVHVGRDRLRLDGRFVDQHHRDIVADRVHASARRALQARAVVDYGDRRLAFRTGQNSQQLRVERHAQAPPRIGNHAIA